MCSRLNFPVVHLGHSPYTSTPQPRVLIAVAPAVDCSLNQASLASQAGVQLRESPANSVALSLVMQAISFVVLLGAACAGVHTVLRLEVLGKFVYIDRFYVAANRVLHLDAVA